MFKLKTLLITTSILIALKFGALNATWMFLLVGAIPGTQYSLPAGVMLMIIGVVIWLVFCQPTVNYSLRKLIIRSRDAKKVTIPVRMPSRRYSQI